MLLWAAAYRQRRYTTANKIIIGNEKIMRHKKLFLFLFIHLFACNIFSQPKNITTSIKKVPHDSINRLLSKILSQKSNFILIQDRTFLKNTLETAEVVDSAIATESDGSKVKYEYTYNLDGNMNTVFIKNWANSNWFINGRKTYTYDSNGNRTSYLYERWDGTNWVNTWQETYTYDSNGNMISHLFGNRFQHTYTYDSNGNRTSDIVKKWDATNWVNNKKNIYTYDSNMNKISEFSETWEDTNWVNFSRATNTFDSSGNRTSYLHEEWDGTNWVNYDPVIFVYDTNGNKILEISETWDGTNLISSWRYVYTYDLNGNRISNLYEIWDGTNWIISLRHTYTYDLNGNTTSYFYENLDGAMFTTGFLRFVDSFGNDYSLTGTNIELFYKTITDVNENDFLISKFELSQNYPNPFNPTTIINYSVPKQANVSLKIYNILGKEVKILVNEYKQIGNYKIQLNASSLPSGIYIYRLQSGDFSETKKLILLK